MTPPQNFHWVGRGLLQTAFPTTYASMTGDLNVTVYFQPKDIQPLLVLMVRRSKYFWTTRWIQSLWRCHRSQR